MHTLPCTWRTWHILIHSDTRSVAFGISCCWSCRLTSCVGGQSLKRMWVLKVDRSWCQCNWTESIGLPYISCSCQIPFTLFMQEQFSWVTTFTSTQIWKCSLTGAPKSAVFAKQPAVFAISWLGASWFIARWWILYLHCWSSKISHMPFLFVVATYILLKSFRVVSTCLEVT